MEEILKILPLNLSNVIQKINKLDSITEIRLRVCKKVILYIGIDEIVLDYIVTSNDLTDILKNISKNSIYSVQNELNKGYITLPGGHRIGFAGEIVNSNEKVKNLKNISSMNIRIAHELVGISNDIMSYIYEENEVLNTLIVSPPCMGKTSILRDVIRNISNGGKNVAVIDERGEIAASFQGKYNLDLGQRTDVIAYSSKAYGIEMALRSLNPNVICTDEIGDEEDYKAIKELSKRGVKYITTMHGSSLEDIKKGRFYELIKEGYLDNVIVLGIKPGNVIKIHTNLSKNELSKERNKEYVSF